MSAPPAPPSLAERFVQVLGGLCRVLAHKASVDRSSTALMVLVWTRINRASQRLAALAARFQAGTLPPPRPRAAASRPRQDRKPPPAIPRRFGWLAAQLPEARAYREYLRQILVDPQTTALLAAAPQAGRLLRPICRMLKMPPIPALALPPRSRAAPATGPAAAKATRTPKPPPSGSRRKPRTPRVGRVQPANSGPQEDDGLPAWVPRLRRPEPA